MQIPQYVEAMMYLIGGLMVFIGLAAGGTSWLLLEAKKLNRIPLRVKENV